MATFRPGKPRWKRLGTNGQALPANATTPLAWASTSWVEGDITLGGTSVTILKAGLYVITASLLVAATVANHNEQVRLRVNGVAQCGNSHNSTAATFPISVTLIEELAVGAVVDAVCVMGSVASTVDSSLTSFRGTRIGPVRWTG